MVNSVPPVRLTAKGNDMTKRAILAALAATFSIGAIHTAAAQDAAETAAILGGVGHAGGSANSLGAAISRSFDNAGRAIGRSSAITVSHRPASAAARLRATHAVPVREASGDPFEGVNAPIYKLGNGTSISATGGLTPEANVRCVKDCPIAR
jgi:hypothetical protein